MNAVRQIIPRTLLVLCCAAAGSLSGCGSGFAGFLPPPADISCEILDEEQSAALKVLGLVNEERLRLGLDALELDEDLSAFAADYACTMIEEGFFAHTHPTSGVTAEDRIATSEYNCHPFGENLAKGQVSPENVVDDWLDSPSHQENLLEPKFTGMGLGVARRQSDGALFWVQMFLGPSIEACALDRDQPPLEEPPAGLLSGELQLFPKLPIGLPLGADSEPVTSQPPKPESDDQTSGG